jgi:hypothetical protein
MMGVPVWRSRPPQVSLSRRVAGWRARYWRRALLAWVVLTLTVMAVAAEPAADFPKAQLGTMPVARTVLRTGGVATSAGVPVVLAILP